MNLLNAKDLNVSFNRIAPPLRPFAKYNIYRILIKYAQGDNKGVGLCQTQINY